MDIKKLENIEKNANMLIIGKRGVGKTSFIISLLQGKKYSQGNIVCSDYENDCYRNKLSFPELNIYNELTEKTLNDIITKCTDSSFIVIENGFSYNNILLNYLETFKKRNITLIMAVQSIHGVSSSDNFDYIVLFKTMKTREKMDIHRRIDTKLTFEKFGKTMDELDNYSPLIYNKKGDDVYWYKI